MSVNATMNTLADIIKPESGPMDVEITSQSENQSGEDKKAYEAKIEALTVPTPDELNSRAQELTARMTDFNCDFHPDERSKFEMRQTARKLFHSLVLSMPEKVDPNDPEWQRKAKEFMLGCEEMDKWLTENEDEEDYTDDEDMPPA